MANTRSRRKSKDGKKKGTPSKAPVSPKVKEATVEEPVETIENDASTDQAEEKEQVVVSDTKAKKVVAVVKTQKAAPHKPVGHSKEIGNGLTELIPGYTAPLTLDTSTLGNYNVGLSELRRRAERTDKSTKDFVVQPSSSKTVTNFLPSNYAAYSFKMGKKKTPDLSAGAGWFKMMSSEVTDQVKTDMALIRNRNYLDPKRFYKKSDKFGKHVQVGTVIEGSAEYYSSRLTKKERRSNLVEEIMADPESSAYAKRKYKKMTHERQAATEQYNKKKRKISKQSRRGY